ncbi:MAG TPA: FMN-binding negative transcriptional regulator [Candidatus Binatia bacterium]|nr:FMN-binding negative transcriptional regulator [Candidatus Binatia bacterium]
MYVPRHFAEDRIDPMRELAREHPFATLVSLGGEGLVASHLPMLWDPEPAPLGTLRGHLARPNPQARPLSDAGSREALAIFVGPQAYVSPSWYPSKREHGKVVPTWNYVAVHAYGPLALVDDPDWLRALVARLTEVHERASAEPWKVTDAPGDFVEAMLRAIVGVEIALTRVEGKWKLGQNRPPADQDGTVAGLRARGDAASSAVADAMAALRRTR